MTCIPARRSGLVGVPSKLCPGTNLVTAGHPEQSYMMVMLGQTPPTMQSPPECAIDVTVGECAGQSDRAPVLAEARRHPGIMAPARSTTSFTVRSYADPWRGAQQ